MPGVEVALGDEEPAAEDEPLEGEEEGVDDNSDGKAWLSGARIDGSSAADDADLRIIPEGEDADAAAAAGRGERDAADLECAMLLDLWGDLDGVERGGVWFCA